MFKKLLIIIFAWFVSLCVFTVNVNADIATISDILKTVPEGFATSEQDAWSYMRYKLYLIDDDTLFTPAVNISTQETVVVNGANRYKYVNPDYYSLVFILNDRSQLEAISITDVNKEISKQYRQINGTYKSPLPTLSNYLNSILPIKNEDEIPYNAWFKTPNKDIYCYKKGSEIVFEQTTEPYSIYSVSLTTRLFRENDNQLRDYYSNFYLNFDYDNELVSITLKGYSEEWVNGTYLITKTIQDISGALPYSGGPFWYNENGKSTYIYSNLDGANLLVLGDTQIDRKNIVTKEGHNYKYVDLENGITITFIMDIDYKDLIGMIVEGIDEHEDDNGTYTRPLMLRNILPAYFPNDSDHAWVNSEGDKVYVSGSSFYTVYSDGGGAGYGITNPIYQDDDGNYYYESGNKYTFVMEDGVLQYITIYKPYYGTTSMFDEVEPYATPEAPAYKLNNEILFTINTAYNTPRKISVMLNDEIELTQDVAYTLKTEPNVAKITLLDSFKKTLTNGSYTASVVVDDYVVETINFTVSNYYPTPVYEIYTVNQVLSTNPYFPTTPDKSWTKDGEDHSLYLNSSYNLVLDNVETIPSSLEVTQNGSNYICDYEGYHFVFNMKMGSLQSINITVDGNEDLSGLYSSNNINVYDILLQSKIKFPTEKFKGWIDDNNINYLYVVNGVLYFDFEDDQEEDYVYLNTQVINNEVSSNNDISIHFNINNDILDEITFEMDENTTYTFKPNTITIGDIIPWSFPNTYYTGWVNDFNSRLYVDEGSLKIGDISLGLVNPLEDIANGYKYSDPFGTSFSFVIENGELQSVVVEESSTTSNNGTYLAPFTVNDMLPPYFPTSREFAWESDDGEILYIGYMALIFECESGSTGYSLDNPVYKNEDGYYVLDGSLSGYGPFYTFNTEDGSLCSVTVTYLDSEKIDIFTPSKPYATVSEPTFEDNGDISYIIDVPSGSPKEIIVKLDGKELDQNSECTVTYEPTITVKLKNTYLKTLSDGEYILSVVVDGYVVDNIKIVINNKKPDDGGTGGRYIIPQTGLL